VKRWICPKCGGGKNAPTRMPALDVRRFCLSCSSASVLLVARSCPSLDKERATKKASRSSKAKKKRATTAKRKTKASAAKTVRADEHRVIDGVDLRAELARIWKLPEVRDLRAGAGFSHARRPSLSLSQSAAKSGWTSGRAWTETGRIHVTISRARWLPEVLEVLAHEVAHHVTAHEVEPSHGHTFRANLVVVMRAAYGVEVDPGVGAGREHPACLDARAVVTLAKKTGHTEEPPAWVTRALGREWIAERKKGGVK